MPLLLMGLLLLACAPRHRHPGLDLGLTAEEKQWLSAHPVITCTHDPYYPPFEIPQADGSHIGYAADLLKHAESVLGKEFRNVQAGTWTEVLDLIRDGKVDCLSSIVPTEERKRFAAFTQPFFVVRPIILGRSGQATITDIRELRGKRVLVTRGYAVVGYLLGKCPDIVLDYVDNDRIALLRLAFGEADYAVSDFPVATYTLREEGITNLRVLGQTGYEYPLSFAVPKNQPQLASILDKVIAHLDPGEREALARKWITLEKRFYEYAEFRIVGGLVVFFVLFSGLTVWLLRKAVNRRTAELRAELVRREAAEKAISDMNVSLGQAMARTEAANQAKSHFLRMVSHEFLTPLNHILLQAELLESALKTPEPEALNDLHGIRESARQLADQVVDILDLVDLESSPIQPRRIPLDGESLAAALRARALPWATANQNALAIDLRDLPPTLEGDSDRLIQALSKLLHNACRFTEGGRVTLGLTLGPGEVVFEVRDTGKGITPRELGRVFEVFSQGEEGLTRAFGGMGLGLAICQHLARKMGGRLSAESRLGEGSVFRLHLPAPGA